MIEEDRFWNKVRIAHPWECWEWLAYKDRDGYGKFYGAPAPRLVLGLSVGDPAHALHRCNNPGCVNPAHLYKGSHVQNMQDKADAGSFKGEKNHNAKVTREQVEDIREWYATGNISQKDLADEYGLTQATVSRIVCGVTWA